MPKLTNKCAICGKPILKSATICAKCASDKEARQREIDSQMEVYNVRLQSAFLWEKRRYEIAKDIFIRCLSSSDSDMRAFCSRELEGTAEDCDLRYEVCWYDEIAAFMAEDIESEKPFLLSDLDLDGTVILGNKYDNPGLLNA